MNGKARQVFLEFAPYLWSIRPLTIGENSSQNLGELPIPDRVYTILFFTLLYFSFAHARKVFLVSITHRGKSYQRENPYSLRVYYVINQHFLLLDCLSNKTHTNAQSLSLYPIPNSRQPSEWHWHLRHRRYSTHSC